MSDTPASPRRPPVSATDKLTPIPHSRGPPITAPHHGWFTSPARSHAHYGHGKELPLHLIQLILEYLDDAADIARVTRTSRLFYYMTLPRLYEEVTLRSYADIRYVNGRPEGYGSGSPFAMGLNTLVSRTFTDYVKTFRVIGEWREHDVEDYSKGRVPDNTMMLQISMRAALDKMKNLSAFAWELNTKPLQSVYEGLMHKASLTTLTLRCPMRRIPRPTTVVPPLPSLKTLIVYDIDPLCYPDNISLLLLTAKKLENLKMHWNPRMREAGEESVNLLNYFGRCIAAKHAIPLKRMALYNLYARNQGEGFEQVCDPSTIEEITLINSMGSSDPMTVFLDDTWRINAKHPIPHNLKMMRGDVADKEHVRMLYQFRGLERLYLVSRPNTKSSKPGSSAATPTTPSCSMTPATNGASGSATGTPKITEHQCKNLASDYLAVIQSNHRTMRHLLLADVWQLSETTLFKICQTCPQLEQLGFASAIPPLESLRQILALVPNLWALRFLIRPGSELAEKIAGMDADMHQFVLATELWRPEHARLKYIGMGDMVWRLGETVWPKGKKAVPEGQENSMNARRAGPVRRIERVELESVKWIEIWGMDSVEFETKFP